MAIRIKKGDILLFSKGVAKAAAFGIRTGQKALSIGRSSLDASIIHAGIVVKGGEAYAGFIQPSVQIVHAIGIGIVKEHLGMVLRTGYRDALILRPPASQRAAAQQAAQTADLWAQRSGQRMQFSRRKAFHAGFGSSSFGPKAQERAREYSNYVNTPGGPPSMNEHADHNKSMFCSMFVVAVYQAVFGLQSSTNMDIDARNCSPMKLQQFLIRKGWDHAGHIYMGSRGIQVVDPTGSVVAPPAMTWN